MKRICSLLYLFYTCLLHGADIHKENVFLLSFPGSGNTWTRYCIEFITKRPTGEAIYLFPMQKDNRRMDCPLNNNFPLGVDYDAPPVIKIHNIKDRFPIGENDYLIVVVRNYKESLLRHLGSDGARARATLQDPDNMYTGALRTYHHWPKERRLLIYYEDFMQFPEKTLYQLADFFQTGHELIPPFIADLEKHRKNGINIYEHTSVTHGKDLHYHGNRISEEMRKEFDALCEALDPEMFNTYLLRYKESS